MHTLRPVADTPIAEPPIPLSAGSRPQDRALIIPDDIGVFLAIARSLGRGGVEVDVATSELDYPGLTSRYVNQVHLVPPYLKETSRWIETIAALTRSRGYRLIVPTSDSSLTLLALHAERLGRRNLAIANDEALAVFTDKAKTRMLADALDIPMASGIEVRPDTDPADLERALGLPLILKPRSPYEPGNRQAKTSASIVRRSENIAGAIAAYGGRGLLAERFFDGDGVGVSVLAHRGAIRLSWQHRRLAAVSDTGHSSRRIGEPVDPVLYDRVKTLCRATELTGVAMFEFRQSPATGLHILIEVNARFWGSLPLALEGGADFPLALWRMQFPDEDYGPRESLRDGVSKCDLSGEYDRLTNLLRSDSKGAGLRASGGLVKLGIKTLIAPASFDSWAADDKRPYFAEVGKIVGLLGKALARRLRDFAVRRPGGNSGSGR